MKRLFMILILLVVVVLAGCESKDYSPKTWEDNAPSESYKRDVNDIADMFDEDPEEVDRVIRQATYLANR